MSDTKLCDNHFCQKPIDHTGKSEFCRACQAMKDRVESDYLAAEAMAQATPAMSGIHFPNVLGDRQGSLKLIEFWGSDQRIIEAARMSTGKGFLGWGTADKPGDEKLLRYLWENKHATPFEMAGFTIEVEAPIMVFREWHRHRTQSYNEMSARYIPLPDSNYLPSMERVQFGGQSKTNRQGSGEPVGELAAREWLVKLKGVYDEAERIYRLGLELGIAKELARLPVPVARMSRMRASANLRNWLGFTALRATDSAQWEIRQYAMGVVNIVQDLFPQTGRIVFG